MSHTHRWMGEITWTHVMNIWYSTSICHVTHRILLLMMNDISLAIGMVKRCATHKCHKWHVTHRISVLIFKIRDIPLVTVTVKRYATYKCHKGHITHRISLRICEYVTFRMQMPIVKRCANYKSHVWVRQYMYTHKELFFSHVCSIPVWGEASTAASWRAATILRTTLSATCSRRCHTFIYREKEREREREREIQICIFTC